MVTLINIFMDVLAEGIQTTINKLPGFVSANIHESLDGTRVVNSIPTNGFEE